MQLNRKIPLIYFYILSLILIIFDQALKLLIHFNMELGEEFTLLGLDWLKIHYTENPGLAFGIKLNWSSFKIFLTSFRIIASCFIAYYIYRIYHKKEIHIGYIVCISMIFAGAIGNVIDSVFYGVFLGNTVPGATTDWFHGQVIDMFFFDIWHGHIMDYYLSIWPIFNIADSSIFVGVACILIFQKKFFKVRETI